MSWPLLLALGAVAYAFKAVGLLALGGRRLSGRAADVVQLLPPALLAGLVAVGTFSDGRSLVVDARAVGLAFAAVGVVKRWPFAVIVIGATVVTAGVRWLAG